MNELLDLVDRATADASWDLDRLVVDASVTGRTRLRRRRAGAALTGCAVLGVLGTGAALLSQGGDATRGVDPATRGVATSTPSFTPTPAPAVRWQLAVTAAQIPATFATVIPGEITTLPQKEYLDTSPIVDFTWNGYAVRVGIIPADDASGTPTDARARCQESSSGQPCATGEVPGSYESTMTWNAPHVDAGASTRELRVSFAQGWDVLVLESTPIPDVGAPQPALPLTLDQLREVAYSGAWFLD